MRNNNNSMKMKAIVVSSGVASAAVMLKFTLPLILDFLICELPLLWSFLLSWLQPPYLYLLINCIIISIVASSKLQPRPHTESVDFPAPSLPEKFPAVLETEDAAAVVPEAEVLFGCVDASVKSPLVAEAAAGEAQTEEEVEETERVEAEEEFVVSRSTWTPPKREKETEYSPVVSAEKPPVSARFAHRKAVKASPEGKTVLLGVSRPKRQETLESTWRTITEGRPMPLKRHLKKSDTFAGAGEGSPVRVMKKSETFGGGSSSPASGGSNSGGRLRREPSLSQEELNRRVEAFIKKFNEQMRLQRQESLSHYRKMVGRGARAQ